MKEHRFDALGTVFTILIDAETVSKEIWQTIEQMTNMFDQKFSRFIENNPINEVHFVQAGSHIISKELQHFLSFAAELKIATFGAFDPAVAGLLDKAGYSNQYTFLPEKDLDDWQVTQWELLGNTLNLSAPTIFDIGAYGKGYWIDEISRFLTKQGFLYHLVDGGGDMYGTEKRDHEPWNVAIEWPGKKEYAIGEVQLKNQGLAVSDIFKRSWHSKNGEHWNHVINVSKKKPIHQFIGSAVIGKDAMTADGLSTACMLIEDAKRGLLANTYQVEYLLFTDSKKVHTSSHWPGKFY